MPFVYIVPRNKFNSSSSELLYKLYISPLILRKFPSHPSVRPCVHLPVCLSNRDILPYTQLLMSVNTLLSNLFVIIIINSVALVRKRTMPTERPPLVGEVVPTFADRGCWVVSATDPPDVCLGFLDRSRYCFFQVVPQLSSRGWVDPVPDPLLLRKSGSSRNRTRDLWICIQKLWPLDHRGGQ
jgi:hypothetical protein